jgi:hypothetical protein
MHYRDGVAPCQTTWYPSRNGYLAKGVTVYIRMLKKSASGVFDNREAYLAFLRNVQCSVFDVQLNIQH